MTHIKQRGRVSHKRGRGLAVFKAGNLVCPKMERYDFIICTVSVLFPPAAIFMRGMDAGNKFIFKAYEQFPAAAADSIGFIISFPV